MIYESTKTTLKLFLEGANFIDTKQNSDSYC